MDINVNYHSSIKIGNICVDPFMINKKLNDTKYIFITHSHYDHFSINDIEKVISENTIFVCTKDVEEKISKIYPNKVIAVEPGKEYSLGDIKFWTIISYNINKSFHPKSNNWVGYIIELDSVKYAILGDSDLTDEVKKIKCDVLFVPIGGTYTMNGKEAAELANIIKPKIVVPVHYNGIVGSKEDETVFLKNLNKEIEYKIYL